MDSKHTEKGKTPSIGRDWSDQVEQLLALLAQERFAEESAEQADVVS